MKNLGFEILGILLTRFRATLFIYLFIAGILRENIFGKDESRRKQNNLL
jgi:hypothetical protein